jgi:predicted O-methyltransferase YrrM
VTFGSWTEPIEGCILHALTQWRHDRGRCVIEIGSFRGRSLAMLAVALRGAGSGSKVISVDPHEEFPFNASQARLALAEWGEEKRLVQYVGGSDEACKVLRPGCASFIFIDGDHTYRQVVNDFENYSELLTPGGCMAFHDYGCGPHDGRTQEEHEVRRAVDEQIFSDRGFRPLLLAHSLFAFVKE